MIKIDYLLNDFKTLIIDAQVKIERATSKGMEKAIKELHKDAIEQVPRCPVASGRLKNSHRSYVKELSSGPIGVLEANTPYAAILHEGFSKTGKKIRYTHNGEGSHWITSKLTANADIYFSILARALREKK